MSMGMGGKVDRLWEIINKLTDDPTVLLEAGGIVSDLQTEVGVLHGMLRAAKQELPEELRDKIENLLERYPM